MYYKLSAAQENDLLKQPETGMGYQIIEASPQGNYTREKFLVLNSELIIQMNDDTPGYVSRAISEGISKFKSGANLITLSSISVLNERQYRNLVSEAKNENEKGAIDNPVENANGEEVLSGFQHLTIIRELTK